MKYLESKQLRGGHENKALRGAPQDKGARARVSDPLGTVQFASPPAKKAALAAGLRAADFRGKKKSSEKGFTKDDVARIAKA